MSNYGYVSGTGASGDSKSFTTTGPSQVKAEIPPGGTAEIKTAVYQADLGDRTEGNQNWGETGGDLADRTSWSDKAREVGSEASDKAREMGYAGEGKLASTTDSLKTKAAETGEVLKEKWEQGKEKAAEVWEQGKQKASDTYQVAKEDAAIAKSKMDEKMEAGKEKAAEMYDSGKQKAVDTYESGKMKAADTYESGKMKAADTYDSAAQKLEPKEPGLMDRVKETVGTATHNVQVKSHEWAESAQNTLEAAREKAREVFVGAQSPKSDVNVSGLGAGGKTEVTVKTTPAPGAYTQVDANTESKIQ